MFFEDNRQSDQVSFERNHYSINERLASEQCQKNYRSPDRNFRTNQKIMNQVRDILVAKGSPQRSPARKCIVEIQFTSKLDMRRRLKAYKILEKVLKAKRYTMLDFTIRKWSAIPEVYFFV